MNAALKQAIINLLNTYEAGKPMGEAIKALRVAMTGPRQPPLNHAQRSILAALKGGPQKFSDMDLPVIRRDAVKAMNSLIRSKRIHIVAVVHGMGEVSRTLALGPKPAGAAGVRATPSRTPEQKREVKRQSQRNYIRRVRAEEQPPDLTPRRDPAAAWF